MGSGSPWPSRRCAAASPARRGSTRGTCARRGTAVRRPWAWRAYAAEQRALVRDLPELERRLPAISAPTTIIAGAHDRVVPARATLRLSGQIPGARLEHSAVAGHLIPQQDPAVVAAAILTALNR